MGYPLTMMGTPVAMEDIARKLGVAVSTVSRALRDMPGIHPATRARVLQEAKALGYVAPRRKKEADLPPRNILTLTIGGEIPSAYLAGMSRASLSHHFSLLSHSFSHEESHRILDPAHQPPLLKLGLVKGIVLVYEWPEEVVRFLCQRYPTASLVIHYPGLPVDLIGIDHVSGILSLVSHLKACGHRRLGFFGLCPRASWARSRFAAYVEALAAFGLRFQADDVVPVEDPADFVRLPFRHEELFDRVAQKVRQGVTAWICANDTVGYGLCAALLQRGIRVPEEAAVTGFHQGRSPSTHLPPLTTTGVDEELLGAEALRRLAERLERPDEPSRVLLLPGRLVEGATSGSLA